MNNSPYAPKKRLKRRFLPSFGPLYVHYGRLTGIMGVSPASPRRRPFTALDDERGARDVYGRFPLQVREVFFLFLTMTTRTRLVLVVF